jgi:hypothetical protein
MPSGANAFEISDIQEERNREQVLAKRPECNNVIVTLQGGQKKSSTRKTSALYYKDYAELPCCLVRTPTKLCGSLADPYPHLKQKLDRERVAESMRVSVRDLAAFLFEMFSRICGSDLVRTCKFFRLHILENIEKPPLPVCDRGFQFAVAAPEPIAAECKVRTSRYRRSGPVLHRALASRRYTP